MRILKLFIIGLGLMFVLSSCCFFDICTIPHGEGQEDIGEITPLQYTQPQLATIKAPPKVMKVNIAERVLFDFDSSAIKPAGLLTIRKVVFFIDKYPDTIIVLKGHTDPVGTDGYNVGLSERRAQSVKNALLEQGLDPAAIYDVSWYGESQLISNINAENRRVMILSVD